MNLKNVCVCWVIVIVREVVQMSSWYRTLCESALWPCRIERFLTLRLMNLSLTHIVSVVLYFKSGSWFM